MLTATDTSSIIDLSSFIKATRDSGYKGLSSAIAELVDNAIEANASQIDIHVRTEWGEDQKDLNIAVCDDGIGMTPAVLRIAVQFGGSTRFNSREGAGRYGIGKGAGGSHLQMSRIFRENIKHPFPLLPQ